MKKSVLLLYCLVSQFLLLAQNVGIGTTTPVSLLEVKDGTLTVTSTSSSANLVLHRAHTNVNTSSQISFIENGTAKWALGAPYIGTAGANKFSLYNYTLGNNVLTVDATNSFVGIGTTIPSSILHVKGTLNSEIALFENTSGTYTSYGILAKSDTIPGVGAGVVGRGGYVGIYGVAQRTGSGFRYGTYGWAESGAESNLGAYGTAIGGTYSIGVYGTAKSGTNNYGVYGTVSGTNNYAGYFVGNVYATGIFQTSDSTLKKDIQPLKDALTIINSLRPSVYTFKTTAYKQMNLPEGRHFGLLAHEVVSVMPHAVKKAVHPSQYEMKDGMQGKKLSDSVAFDAVNYTEMIPVLIAAVKEQQAIIMNQQKEIMENNKQNLALEARLEKLESLISYKQ